ncbi:MAG: VWA-like domain-containing protein [Candidatus Thermoplasmatota archaeon]|nr:VWA-like domain-containing protein [Candidatus Thermoplasmatota archaeon]
MTEEDSPEEDVKHQIAKPTPEDEAKKEEVLNLWLEDRMTLVTWRPFLGILAMHLDLIPVVDHRCQTACTDGRRIFFNPYHIGALSPDERIAILAHEIWHCGLLHFSREIGRIDQHKAWNYAIDHEVNSLLNQDGFVLPHGAVLYQDHVGKSAEQIFDMIASGELPIEGMLVDEHYVGRPESDGEGGDKEGCEDISGPLVEDDGEGGLRFKVDSRFLPRRSDDVWKEWRANLKSAAQRCGCRGVDMSGYSWAIEDLLEPRIHWKEVLRQFITPVLGSARQWLPPNRRFVTQGLYLPSRRTDQELQIVIAIDTSGSTMGPIVQEFITEVASIIHSFGAYRLTIIQADFGITAIDEFTHEEEFKPEDFEIVGGGGTDLCPPFEWVEDNMPEPPKALLYMTDGFGPTPQEAPEYPVLWVLNQHGRQPCHWGEIVRIEDK